MPPAPRPTCSWSALYSPELSQNLAAAARMITGRMRSRKDWTSAGHSRTLSLCLLRRLQLVFATNSRFFYPIPQPLPRIIREGERRLVRNGTTFAPLSRICLQSRRIFRFFGQSLQYQSSLTRLDRYWTTCAPLSLRPRFTSVYSVAKALCLSALISFPAAGAAPPAARRSPARPPARAHRGRHTSESQVAIRAWRPRRRESP